MTTEEINIHNNNNNNGIQAQKAEGTKQGPQDLNMDYSKYDFKDSTELYVYLSKKGLSRGTVEEISRLKGEPDWMRDFRLRSYDVFMSKPMPNWGGDLSHIDLSLIHI